MTQDEIIEMAIQAHYDSKTWIDIYKDEITAGTVRGYLEDFAKLVAAKEREACAKIVLGIANDDAGNPYKQPLRIGAEAIRARGQA